MLQRDEVINKGKCIDFATIGLNEKCSLVVHPRRVIEDVLVKVDKFIFLVDFVVLDMEEDENALIILGFPFLNTCDLEVEVRLGKLTL